MDTARLDHLSSIAQRDRRQRAAQLVGGERQLDELLGWAARSLPADKIGDPDAPAPGTVNHTLSSGSARDAELAVHGLRRMRQAQEGGDDATPDA